MSLNKCILLLPLFFAVGNNISLIIFTAHMHHLYRDRHLPPPLFKKAVLGKIFQLCFTTVFGIYAGYAYVYTGSLWAAIFLHA